MSYLATLFIIFISFLFGFFIVTQILIPEVILFIGWMDALVVGSIVLGLSCNELKEWV